MAVTVALLGLGAALAAYFPSRRAARIDPVRALRYE
jgi:ABC-type lipoprotein release transport system permease subunit